MKLWIVHNASSYAKFVYVYICMCFNLVIKNLKAESLNKLIYINATHTHVHFVEHMVFYLVN